MGWFRVSYPVCGEPANKQTCSRSIRKGPRFNRVVVPTFAIVHPPQGNEDIRSVVMINCGAICNVVDLLSQLSPEAYVYIVDSNRPVHLANVYPKKDR